jgi:hypothetical protein
MDPLISKTAFMVCRAQVPPHLLCPESSPSCVAYSADLGKKRGNAGCGKIMDFSRFNLTKIDNYDILSPTNRNKGDGIHMKPYQKYAVASASVITSCAKLESTTVEVDVINGKLDFTAVLELNTVVFLKIEPMK